jgi:hypothetical protein
VLLDRNAYANNEDRQFMNTFLDNNNAIIPLKIGPGAAVLYNPTEWISLVASMADADAQLFQSNLDTTFDGEFDFMGYFEIGLRARLPFRAGPLRGNYRFGLLLDPRGKTVFGSEAIDGSDEGVYLSLDQQVLAEKEASKQGFGLFARYGWRPGDVNRLEYSWSAGAQYLGLTPSRDQDVIALGMYSAIGSDSYVEFVNPSFERENGFEAYYSVQLTPAIALTPDGQYIKQPGGLKSSEDTWLFALRLRLALWALGISIASLARSRAVRTDNQDRHAGGHRGEKRGGVMLLVAVRNNDRGVFNMHRRSWRSTLDSCHSGYK